MMITILNSAILDSTILHKKTFTYLFWLILIMAAMLNSAIFKSAILHSAILHKTLTQSNSIWLKVIHSHSPWWWQPSWILPYWIHPFCTKKTSLIHSVSTWWWQPSWICHLGYNHFAQNSDSNYFNLSQTHSFSLNLKMAAIMNSAILGSPILHKTLTQTISIWLKLIHSHLTWRWLPSWILPSWILPCWNQPIFTKLWLKLIHFDSNSFILIQLDDGSHLEFCHLEFCHVGISQFSQNSDSNYFNLTQTQSF